MFIPPEEGLQSNQTRQLFGARLDVEKSLMSADLKNFIIWDANPIPLALFNSSNFDKK